MDLRKRFSKFNLERRGAKPRWIEVGRFAHERRKKWGEGKPETFNCLGFTCSCGKKRNGEFQIIRRTIRKRMRMRRKTIRQELKRRLHNPISATGRWLRKVLQGDYQYFGVPPNSRVLGLFRQENYKAWYRCLKRRSQKSRMTWKRMNRIAKRWLPSPRIAHPYPEQRCPSYKLLLSMFHVNEEKDRFPLSTWDISGRNHHSHT